MFSQRSDFERRRNRLQLAREAAAREGRAPLDLTESNPTAAQLPYPAQLLAALHHPDANRYRPEPLGLKSARQAISEWMAGQGCAVDAEHIVVTAGTSEAYAFLFKLLCNAGDEVLVPAPSYPLFAQLAQLELARIANYPLRYDGHWHVALEAVQAARSERTRALVAVHPNNPTGSYLKRDELAALGSLGLPLISDEVFAPYPLEQDSASTTSALMCRDTLVFTLHGLSKLAGLPQLKLAWICLGGPAPLVDEARARLELIADAFLSVATPVQLALPAILAGHAPITAAISARIAHNLRRLREVLRGSALDVLRVEGGWYAVVRLPNLLDDEAWAVHLLQSADVLVQPGYFYDFETGPYIVLGLLTPESVFERGITRMLACVSELAQGGLLNEPR